LNFQKIYYTTVIKVEIILLIYKLRLAAADRADGLTSSFHREP